MPPSAATDSLFKWVDRTGDAALHREAQKNLGLELRSRAAFIGFNFLKRGFQNPLASQQQAEKVKSKPCLTNGAVASLPQTIRFFAVVVSKLYMLRGVASDSMC